MSKLTLAIVAVLVAGCASTREWSTLTIDSSSEQTFGDSLSLLNDTLPHRHREMLALALVDIAQTETLSAADASDEEAVTYTYDDFRRQLDGLTYGEIIALADRSGTPISRLYSAHVQARTGSEASGQLGTYGTPPDIYLPPGRHAYEKNRD